jgi:selenocysteine-specific elongation factor
LFDAALQSLVSSGKASIEGGRVSLAGQGPKLSRPQQQLLGDLIEWLRSSGIDAPGFKSLQDRAPRNKDAVPLLLDLAVAEGQLVAIGPDYWLHAEVESQARERVAAAMHDRSGMTLSEIRELLGTTRKYAVPLCEYWDRTSFTVRQGDLRRLNA